MLIPHITLPYILSLWSLWFLLSYHLYKATNLNILGSSDQLGHNSLSNQLVFGGV
jgi:hypothetical protein